MPTILCTGEAMAELRQGSDGFTVSFAGDAYNTAVYCRRLLGQEHGVGFLSCIGTDPLSDAFAKALNAEGLPADLLERDPNRNIGIYSIVTDANGERRFHYWRSESAARSLFGVGAPPPQLQSGDILYLTAVTVAILPEQSRERLLAFISELRTRGVRFTFDSNYRPRLWLSADEARHWISKFWRVCDIALPSMEDEANLFGYSNAEDVIRALSAFGCSSGALKRGSLGPLAIGPGHDWADRNWPVIKNVVDTTAAGDGFNAGFLAAISAGRSTVEALGLGHAVASEIIQHVGGIVPLSAWPASLRPPSLQTR